VTVSGNTVQPTLQILPTSTTLNRGSSEIIDFVVGGLQPASPVVDKDINVYFKVLGATATQSLLTDAELTSWTGPTGVTYSNVFRATIHGTNQQTNTGHNDVKVTLNTAGLTSRSLTIQMVGYDGTSYETNGTTFSYKPPGGSISVQPMLEGANPVTLNLIAPKPSGTTADLILRHDADGQYEIYNIGNNSILAGYLLGQVGTDYQVAGLGAFNGSGQSGAISSASVVSMSAASTSDMMLRSSTTGSFWIYNISANNIVGAASLGAVGLNWQMAGLGDFNHDGTTDMMLRNSGNGAFYVYDINSNQISFATPMGAVGLDWQMAGFGDFNGDGTTDMLLRNTSSGTFEFYDIVNNQLTSANVLGTVGLDWKVAGFGDFNGDGATDMMLRNATSGMFELYNINNNSLTGASAIGTVGLDWQVAGFGPISGTGNSDMVLRNVSTGAFEVYDIANNQLTGAASLGQVGLDWQFGGFAVDSPSASGASTDDAAQVPQLVQAMAGFSSGSGAAENLNALALGADTAQEPVLTTVQHV
jgi:hypothetical protein